MPNNSPVKYDEDGNAIVVRTESEQGIIDRAAATGHYGGANPFLLQALNANTIEEATAITGVISGKEHLNERIRYLGCSFVDSDPDLHSDIPVFAVCDVIREMGDGVAEKMSIGAGQVVGTLIRACELDWFPFDAELVSVDLGGGRKAINLQPSPTRVDSETEKDW